MRLVSLLPSATEIVYALGLSDDLVGVSFECDEPASARIDKAVVVGGLDTSTLTPREIDEQVRARTAAGENLYTLHADSLAALAPDLILSQDLCQVCALPAGQVAEALAFLGCSADVLSLDPHSLAEVLTTIVTVGIRTGVEDRARRLVSELDARLAAIATRTAGLGRPRVAVLEWTDPPFTAGHWVPDLVAAAGGVAVAAEPGGRSVQTTFEAIAAEHPDIVLVAPCGYRLDDAVRQARQILDRLPADVPVWAIDADGLVVRPGPRLVDGVEAIAAVLHPAAVDEPPPGAIARVR